jgi:hypothetical protein
MRTIKVSETKAKATISDLLQCIQKSAIANGSTYRLNVTFDRVEKGEGFSPDYKILLSMSNTEYDESYILGYFAVCYFLSKLFKDIRLASTISLGKNNTISIYVVEREIGTIIEYLNGN